MMKAIVFTMDSIFALVIAVVGISVLLFFQYSAQAPYSLHYSNAQAIFTNLASASVGSVSSNPIARSLSNQYAGINETWPMFLNGPSANNSNLVGPSYPILAFTFNPGNTITTGVVAGYGNVYFAANSIFYAINATMNKVVWTTNTVSNVAITPALFSGTLYYANTTNLTAVSPNNGNIIWSTNSIKTISVTTSLLAYDNLIIFGGSNNDVYAYYANNGTQAWAKGIGAVPVSLALAGGTLVIKTSTNVVYIAVYSGTLAPTPLATITYTSGTQPTRLAYGGNTIYFGTGSTSNAMYVNGTTASGFPLGEIATISGVAVYTNYTAYQTANTVTVVSPSGTTDWLASIPIYFGANVVNATPAIGSGIVYTLWTNGLAAENLTNGKLLWFAYMPSTPSYPYMTLAYGRLYLEINNNIFVYGSCYSPPYATLLYAAAAMSLNGQGGCASALLNSVYPAANYTFFTGTPSTNTVNIAQFNGAKGYVIARNSGMLNSTYVSASFWVNVSALPATGVRLLNYGDNSTCADGGGYCGWNFYLTNTGKVIFSVMNSNQFSANDVVPLQTKKWYMITGVDNGTVALYINGNVPYTQAAVNTLALPAATSPNIPLTIGAGLTSDSRYFTGNIADVQIYNTTLNRQQIGALFREGVAGVPVSSTWLVAWYPLAGDANDYANFNTGFLVGSTKFIAAAYTSPAFSNAYEISRASVLLPVLNYTTGTSNTINVGIYSWG
ncbi:MAG: PQQ-binding-like beta-propeller repeat protein [Candidatus Micrarchaeota archaeon]|nr:PQQ-binding-like beta-propeller repeat protein [Candidatus Micrarchaeota archaeon]